GVAGDERKLCDLARGGAPDDRPELEDLRRDAGRIVHRVLRPSDRLAAVVGPGGEAVVAAERRQRLQDAVLPDEPEAREAGRRRAGEERRAAPVFSERVRSGRLADSGEPPGIVLDGPRDVAVVAAERAEIRRHAVSPQRRVPALVAGEV